MGIRQNLSNRITTKVGQKAFKIEDIKEKCHANDRMS